MWSKAAVWLLFGFAAAAPTGSVHFEKCSPMPRVTFADATYQATKYNKASDIYHFKNIRFAAPPVGDLRFAKPAPPQKNGTLQDGSYGNQCPNAQVNGFNLFGSASDRPNVTMTSKFLTGIADGFENEKGDEDCLFLDIYVPGDAVRNPNKRLPVMHWFFGGGFVFGGKNYVTPIMPFYDGSGMLETSHNKVIWVASNYRLGALGWLAGSTMEAQGTPNAGLWDQHAALQWVKDNIGKLGGDGNDITAYGMSSGASSLLHHLVLEGGKKDPIFKKAIFMSTAYQPFFDRRGALDEVFQNFTRLAGCNESTVACLRSLDSDTVIRANQDLNAQATPGSFLVGPAPDGSLIRQNPTLEFVTGNYWKGLQGAIVSHVADEATLFVDGTVRTDSELAQFERKIFPNYLRGGVDQAVLNHYPSATAPRSPYTCEGDRVRAIVRDACMNCHSRLLAEIYKDKVWSMQYSIWPAVHSSDLITAFYSNGLQKSLIGGALGMLNSGLADISKTYKSYFASLALTGNPNRLADTSSNYPAVQWPHPDTGGENVTNVLEVNSGNFTLIADDKMPKSACDFWREFLSAATVKGGYAPPDAVVQSSLLSDSHNASACYHTPE